MDNKNYTLSVHSGAKPEPTTGAIMPPIFQTSTYVQSEPGVHKGYDYSRADNPTREVLEKAIANLEHADYGLTFSSGLAAVQAVLQMLEPGAHVLVCEDVYGGTGRLFRKLFAKYSIEFEFIDMRDVNSVKEAMKPETKLVWIETPTNPTLRIIDIEAVGKLCKGRDTLLCVDNTFCSPMFQRPLALGADIVLHSTTKYIGGHSDIIGGAVVTSDKKLFDELKFIQFAAGAVPGPIECFLLHRSILTLAIRMKKHEENAFAVARFLEKHPKVESVYYPGLESHPQHEIAKKQMDGYSGMVSFDFKGSYEEVVQFLKNLKVFTLAESLGGVESLVNHPEQMTHASVPEDLRRKLGINANLIRLSVGIEDADDLVNDLKDAFK